MLNDAIDLFPTPKGLAEKMVKSISTKEVYGHLLLPDCILEPSAGTGSLAKVLKEMSYNSVDLDCIEIAASCRAILKSQNLRVIHDDFLTFEPFKQYNAIIMNPPFSTGAAHLLKAINILRNGGKICCLLRSESIRHPHGSDEKELAVKLKELDADVEYIAHAFEESDRPTSVEIAFITINIPEKDPVSRIRLDLKKGYDDRMKNPEFHALMSNNPILAAVEQYKLAATGLRRIFEEYNGIKDFLTSPNNPCGNVLNIRTNYNSALRDLRMKYWKALFDIPEIRDRLTETMRQEYAERISTLADYDFSQYNILTIREEIAQNTVQAIEDEILKLFDYFTRLNYAEYSQNIHYFNGWSTNSAYKIGQKVIFPCNAFCKWYNNHYEPTSHTVIRALTNIELTFHYLDSNGGNYDSSELRKKLTDAGKENQTRNIHLHYFDVSFFKKGTCHLVFTNMDVLKSFNFFVSQKKSWLPPSYGKCKYEDMPQDERQVVDSFEGKSSYTDSMNRGLLLTSRSFLALPM